MEKTKKERLHFGIICPSLDITEKYNLLGDLDNFAYGRDLHFTAYFGTYPVTIGDYASHYDPCFEDINRNSALDGVIIFSSFITHNVNIDKFMKYVGPVLERLPVVSIGLPIPGACCVLSDNMSGMYKAVSHLIREDKKKRIVFIKGPDGHPEADARFEGYLKALSDNGIARDDSLIFPGNFTPGSGHVTVDELIARKAEFDAIVGCNDECAMGAIRKLIQRGYSLPRDVAIMGFDDVSEAASIKPSLSSVRQDFSKLGVIAGDALHRIISNEQVDNVINVTPELILRCSCGCNKRERRKVSYRDDVVTADRFRRMTIDNLLLEYSLESLGDRIRKSLPSVALRFALIGIYRTPIEHDPVLGAGVGDRSINVLFGFDRDLAIHMKVDADMPFPLSNFSAIEGIDFERERHSVFFLPLFSGNEERGAALIAYNSFNPVTWYESLRTNIAAAIKGADLIEKIQALSITDELTGLLNRRGFLQQAHTRLQYLQREPEYMSAVFAIDMDGLKQINDTYGHAEGNVAIIVFADLLRESVRMGDIIGRMGGDEFTIFTVIKSKDDIQRFESRIRRQISDYNAEKKHPFDVLGSIGTAILSESTIEAFDQAMLDADAVLYEEKQEKRSRGLSRD